MRTNPLAVPLVAVFSVVGAYGIITAASANLRERPAHRPATVTATPATAVEAAQPLAATTSATPAQPVLRSASAHPTPTSPSRPARSTSAPAAERNPAGASRAFIDQVYELTNHERRRAGLRPLTRSLCLAKGARAWTSTMAERNTLEHQGLEWIQSRCSFRIGAENIAQGHRSAEAMVRGWMNSSGHRQNILNPQFTHFGVGYSSNGNFGTQNFGG